MLALESTVVTFLAAFYLLVAAAAIVETLAEDHRYRGREQGHPLVGVLLCAVWPVSFPALAVCLFATGALSRR